ncbi:hypothetical protein DHEL01_v204455 [Diaporthe helianthi]|uniref:Rhodopsin domain-containing protein n=1 Tax=Diaporthe helianthi TaxID=158607 RepID=A0A2P5I3S8_DIAHE|nr:hypothetical protein DHEL01_v204455 [Diaporthe helianthi]
MSTDGPYPPTLPHDSLVPNIIACAVVTWAIAAVFVALRFYTRTCILSVIGWSDWLILTSWIFSCGVTASAIEQSQRGIGKHVYDHDWTNLTPFQKAAWYGVLFYTLSLGFSKVSMVLLYLNLFSYHWVRVAGRLVLATVIISTLWMLCVVFTACIPLEAYWVFALREKAFCQPQSAWWANVGLHMSTDFIIFALPLPVLPTLRMPRRQKWMLAMVFSLGFFVCIVSIVRLMKLLQTENHPSLDFSYDSAGLVYWTSIEVQGAIVCACAVTLKPLLNHWMPQWFSAYRQDNPLRQNPAPLTIGQRASRKLSKIEQQTTSRGSWTVDRPSKDLEAGLTVFDQERLGNAAPSIQQQLSDLPSERREDAASNRDSAHSTLPPPPPTGSVRTSSLSALRGLAVGAFLDDSSLRRQHRASISGHQRSLTTSSSGSYDSSSERLDWDLEGTS